MDTTITRDVASAVVWLTDAQADALLDLLLEGDHTRAGSLLLTAIPDLSDRADLADPQWREALMTELRYRLQQEEGEPDDLSTREVPDYARFAHREAS